MKGILTKVIGVIAGAIALFGISIAAPASSNITGKSPLFLEHGKTIGSNTTIDWHSSHASHESHESHASHSSGY